MFSVKFKEGLGSSFRQILCAYVLWSISCLSVFNYGQEEVLQAWWTAVSNAQG